MDNYAHVLEIVLEWYKTQEMCIKAVNDYPSAIQIVPECYKTQEMCVGAVNTYWFGVISLKNAKFFKKDKLRINACGMAS